jgi:hypothetical protein
MEQHGSRRLQGKPALQVAPKEAVTLATAASGTLRIGTSRRPDRLEQAAGVATNRAGAPGSADQHMPRKAYEKPCLGECLPNQVVASARYNAQA